MGFLTFCTQHNTFRSTCLNVLQYTVTNAKHIEGGLTLVYPFQGAGSCDLYSYNMLHTKSRLLIC